MKMSLKLTEEDISHCRRGSDIDLEAIFGGHISGKRTKGIKSNPLFNDRNHVTVNNMNGSMPFWDLKHNSENVTDGGVDIEVYSNIPVHVKGQLDKQSDTVGSSDDNTSMMSARQERDSLKVTNGKDLIGDIVIEQGYSNLAFEMDNVNCDISGDSKHHDADKQDSVSSQTANAEELKGKNESRKLDNGKVMTLTRLDSLVVSVDKDMTAAGSGRLESDEISGDKTEVKGISVINESSESSWQDIDDITVAVTDLHSEHQLCVENERNKKHLLINNAPAQSKDNLNNNHVICSDQNLKQILNYTHENQTTDLDPTETQEGSYVNGYSLKQKNCKKKGKISERKNSVPEMILHSINEKPIRPILLTSVSVEENANSRERTRSSGDDQHKSVKFSEDTVFNENRPNKYRKEKVSLKDVYRGKITSKTAVAKPNPLFVDDEGSLTDDEKAARYSRSVEIHDVEVIETEPRFDQLIKRTQAKQRRSKLVRLILATLAFLVVIVVVVLLVIYFGKS